VVAGVDRNRGDAADVDVEALSRYLVAESVDERFRGNVLRRSLWDHRHNRRIALRVDVDGRNERDVGIGSKAGGELDDAALFVVPVKSAASRIGPLEPGPKPLASRS
jgi:hypothetical protein